MFKKEEREKDIAAKKTKVLELRKNRQELGGVSTIWEAPLGTVAYRMFLNGI